MICVLNKKTHGNNVVSAVWGLAQPVANALGLELWDIKFVKEGPEYFLRIFIDSDSGITIDDCEKMSRAIDKPLDELDPIVQNYCLEVCSPGVNRELSRDKHLEKFIGHKIIVRLIRPPEDGSRELSCVLCAFNKDEINVSCADGFCDSCDSSKQHCVLRKNIAFIKLDDFDD